MLREGGYSFLLIDSDYCIDFRWNELNDWVDFWINEVGEMGIDEWNSGENLSSQSNEKIECSEIFE